MAEMDCGEVFASDTAQLKGFLSIDTVSGAHCFCLMCEFSANAQTDPRLAMGLQQIDTLSRSTTMGHNYKVRNIHAFYLKSLVPLLPVTMPIWPLEVVAAHLSGLHLTASATEIKQLDTSQMCQYVRLLNDHAIEVTDTGLQRVNIQVVKLRLSLSGMIHNRADTR